MPEGPQGTGVIAVETEIRIEHDVDGVFAYVSDPGNFPRWNSAVTDVQPGPASTFRMTRRLPTGVATNELRIVALEPPERFTLETTSGPTPFRYEYRFAAEGPATVVRLAARADVGPVASLLGAVARRGLASGIRANLTTLKRILEARPGSGV